ncbi:MAG: hypothetical protein R3192_09660 [Woeseiaceae bacterium]|nr:hypothetical protein [Woeseiaceae bacterium]
MRPANELLLRSLGMNALFSAISGCLMLLFADWIAAQLGLAGPASVYGVAVFLLIFAAQLANIRRTGVIRDWEIVGIIAGDLAWVAASVVLAVMYRTSISAIGLLLIDSVALVVLAFALMQMRGLHFYRAGS